LGPTGYPFERLIGEIFKRKGFNVEVGVIVNGQCITHEMDVIATKKSLQHIVECKYHKDQGSHVSIQVPLYVRARVDDIISTREKMPEYKNTSFLGWVITNTRFSTDSIAYSKCSGLNLLAWDFPQGEGLKDIIETLKIYPITILDTLQLKEKRYLLDKGITTCKELLSQPELLNYFNFNTKKHASVIQELNNICS
jgi:Holliday junction resolvase-like predicted endonuclease